MRVPVMYGKVDFFHIVIHVLPTVDGNKKKGEFDNQNNRENGYEVEKNIIPVAFRRYPENEFYGYQSLRHSATLRLKRIVSKSQMRSHFPPTPQPLSL